MNGEFFSFGRFESSYFFNFTLYVSPIEIASHTLILCIFHQLLIPSRHSYGIFLPDRAFFDMKSSYFFTFTLYMSPFEIASHTLILCIFHQLQIPSRHSYGIFLPIRAFFDMNQCERGSAKTLYEWVSSMRILAKENLSNSTNNFLIFMKLSGNIVLISIDVVSKFQPNRLRHSRIRKTFRILTVLSWDSSPPPPP